jgi:hypothetical protein
MIMKKILFHAAIAALCLSACSTDDPEEGFVSVAIDAEPAGDPVTITFQCRGDFSLSTSAFTRAELKADGKAMTDIWILDYVGGSLAQSAIHQVSTDDDFGTPTLNLSVGSHHVYFIASRGKTPTLDTDGHTLTFVTVSDTFYKDYEINVTASSNGSRTVTLERCVTKLTATITDAIPEGSATFNLTPEAWHYGIDYTTGQPISATPSQMITINIPSSEIGVANEPLNIFGFSGPDEWTINVTLNCKKSDGTILGTATLTDVPLKRNRITAYSGPLFSAEGLTTVSLSSDWLEEHTGTW